MTAARSAGSPAHEPPVTATATGIGEILAHARRMLAGTGHDRALHRATRLPRRSTVRTVRRLTAPLPAVRTVRVRRAEADVAEGTEHRGWSWGRGRLRNPQRGRPTEIDNGSAGPATIQHKEREHMNTINWHRGAPAGDAHASLRRWSLLATSCMIITALVAECTRGAARPFGPHDPGVPDARDATCLRRYTPHCRWRR